MLACRRSCIQNSPDVDIRSMYSSLQGDKVASRLGLLWQWGQPDGFFSQQLKCSMTALGIATYGLISVQQKPWPALYEGVCLPVSSFPFKLFGLLEDASIQSAQQIVQAFQERPCMLDSFSKSHCARYGSAQELVSERSSACIPQVHVHACNGQHSRG